MNPANEFINKEMLQIVCSCDKVAYIFVDNLIKPYITICRKCGKKIYQVTCSKCKSGFAFPEDAKSLHISEAWWKCETCGEKNNFSPKEYEVIKNYYKNEIPEEVWNRYKTLWSYWWLKLLMLFLLLIAIYLWIISAR